MRVCVRFCHFLAVCVIALPGSGSAHAQAQDDEQVATESTEEIVVYGQKSFFQLRAEVIRAEDNAFALFNSLNDDDDYDIRCRKEARTGSKMRRRVCRPQYERDATAAEARALHLGVPRVPAWTIIMRKEEILLEKWGQLAIEQPEFREAVSQLADAQQELEFEQQRRCEDRIFFCGN